MNEGELEQLLVEWIHAVQPADIPQRVLDVTNWFLLDALGVAMAGAASAGGREVMELVKSWGGRPESSLWVYGGRVPAPNAAFANSVLIHALDFDDTYVQAGAHVNAVVLPAAMAAAEQAGGVTGRDFLCALIVGSDMACRLGLAARDGLHPGRLPTALFGAFGAATAAGKILKLDIDCLRNALGLAYAQTLGERQSLIDGALAKRLEPGFAARDALFAVQLAKRGITGPAKFLTGKAGLFALYSNNDYDPLALTEGLGHRFYGAEMTLKSYPCCSAAQGVIEAALRIRARGLPGLGEIEQVVVYAPEDVLFLLAKPLGSGIHPQVDAQFNIPYLTASALLNGPVRIADIEPETVLANQPVQELSRRVSTASIETERVRHVELPVTVEVLLKDGRVRKETIEQPTGLCTDKDWNQTTASKFSDCMKYAYPDLSDAKVDRLMKMVLQLERLEKVECLIDELQSVWSLPTFRKSVVRGKPSVV
jgi:2-methylcitrate dehydratase PrpD